MPRPRERLERLRAFAPWELAVSLLWHHLDLLFTHLPGIQKQTKTHVSGPWSLDGPSQPKGIKGAPLDRH